MPNLRLSDKLMFSTVKITCLLADNKTSNGTGFIFAKDNALAIVTNEHVIKNSITGEFSLSQGNQYNEPVPGQGIKVEFSKFSEKWVPHPDNKTDLVITPFRPIIQESKKQGKIPFFTRIQSSTIEDVSRWREFIPIEDIIMIGYPYNLWDKVNNLPFYMKGITATHPGINYNGNEEFVINTPVYPGSSGSPVFRLTEEFYNKSRNYEGGPDHVRLLGVAYKHLFYTKEGKVVTEMNSQDIRIKWDVILDLGIAIRSTKLKDFESVMESEPMKWEL